MRRIGWTAAAARCDRKMEPKKWKEKATEKQKETIGFNEHNK